MVNDNNSKNEIQDKRKEQKAEEIQRITVSKQVQDAVTEIVEKINNGFMGGRINRTQAANWVLMRFYKNISDLDINEIRAEYFDEVALLEYVLRKAKEDGKVPTEFRALLQKQLESYSEPKKKPKKSLTSNYVNDVI